MNGCAPSVSARLAMILLGAWLGAAVFFSAVVAPAAFRVLPSREMAGALVGAMLPYVFIAGTVIGIAAAALRFGEPSGARRTLGVATGAGAALCCAVGQYLGHRIDALRAGLTVPLDSLPAANAAREAFGRLHASSVVVLGVAMVFATVALVVAARGKPVARTELA